MSFAGTDGRQSEWSVCHTARYIRPGLAGAVKPSTIKEHTTPVGAIPHVIITLGRHKSILEELLDLVSAGENSVRPLE